MIRIITKHKTMMGLLCIITGIIIYNLFSVALIAIGIAFIVRAYYSNKNPDCAEADLPLSRIEKGHVIADTRSGQNQIIHQQMGNSPISQAYLRTCSSCGSNISENSCTRCRIRTKEEKITHFR